MTSLTVTNQSIPRTGGGESAHQIPAYLDPYLILISRRYSAADTPQIYTYVYKDTLDWSLILPAGRTIGDLCVIVLVQVSNTQIPSHQPTLDRESAVPFQKERTFIDTSFSHTTKNWDWYCSSSIRSEGYEEGGANARKENQNTKQKQRN